MMTVSPRNSAQDAVDYVRSHLTSAATEYYTEGETVVGKWYGKLAEHLGLRGDVNLTHFERMAHGRHPITNELLVRAIAGTPYQNEQGETITPMLHAAGQHVLFSAPKEISAACLVGGDQALWEDHRAATLIALQAVEQYIQCRVGPAETTVAQTTGNAAFAIFEHNSARPVNGYSAPQLHSHAYLFNMTESASGRIRSVQSIELMKSQALGTLVYRTELARRVTERGYTWTLGEHQHPKLDGFSPEYLTAISQRRALIVEHLRQSGRTGAAAAQLAALETRERKATDVSKEEMQAQHQLVADAYGNEPARVVAAARERGPQRVDVPAGLAETAVKYARAQQFERKAVVDERRLEGSAILRSMGILPVTAITQEFNRQHAAGSFIEREPTKGAAARSFTTPEMIALERAVIDRMTAGAGQHRPIATEFTRAAIAREFPHLDEGQAAAVQAVLAWPDEIMGISGKAGVGKTTALKAVAAGAEREGFAVYGLAPTSSAARNLRADIPQSTTLARHLAMPVWVGRPPSEHKLYFLDEASLASTADMRQLLNTLQPSDRIIVVGDIHQHQSVEAGRVFEQLLAHGLPYAAITEIRRQTTPWYREVVEHLSEGRMPEAFQILREQDRITEIKSQGSRVAAVAADYCNDPVGTIIAAPDHESRELINAAVHEGRITSGAVHAREAAVPVLVIRHDLTDACRAWSGRYAVGNVLRYNRTSEHFENGSYARVEAVNPLANLLTVRRQDGTTVEYDPRRLAGVTVFREGERQLSVGDRVRVTQVIADKRLANGDRGTIVAVSPTNIRVRLDDEEKGEGKGRSVGLDLTDPRHRHLDYGYAITTYTSQSLTDRRVLYVVDTDRGGEDLLNQRSLYVGGSRGEIDLRVYCNDTPTMIRALSRDVSARSAIEDPPQRTGRTR